MMNFVLNMMNFVLNMMNFVGKAFYGDVLVSSFVMVLVAAGCLVIHQMHRHRQPLR